MREGGREDMEGEGEKTKERWEKRREKEDGQMNERWDERKN